MARSARRPLTLIASLLVVTARGGAEPPAAPRPAGEGATPPTPPGARPDEPPAAADLALYGAGASTREGAVRAPVPWLPHLELGGGLGFFHRAVVEDEARPAGIRYRPALGYTLQARVDLLRWLALTTYYVEAHHPLELPVGALGLEGATFDGDRITTYVLGARLAPVLRPRDRLALWVSAGVGWGRFEFPRLRVAGTSGAPFVVRERSVVLLQYPLGVGASFEVVRGLALVSLEAAWGPVDSSTGDAFEPTQAVDANGARRSIGALPPVASSLEVLLGAALRL